MKTYYKEKKSPRGLLGKWLIPLGGHYIECFVWGTREFLLENVSTPDNDVDACYAHYPQRKITGGLFGEIHAVYSEATPGTVAHELTHALFDWMRMTFRMVNLDEQGERLCETMEIMTEAFWKSYMETFLSDEISSDEVSDVENTSELVTEAPAKRTRKKSVQTEEDKL